MENNQNPYFPYKKVQEYATLPKAEKLLKKIVDYILDLPAKDYTPPDRNDFPRCRLIKELFYDEPNYLENPIPTPEQKLQIVFNPNSPDVAPTAKGYRIFPMIYPIQSQAIGQTTLKIFMSYAKATSVFRIDQAIAFEVLTSTVYENNEGGTDLSRTYAICTDIMEAFNGVNIDGVGTFFFDRRQNTECTIEPISDKSQNVGYRLTMGVSYIGGENNGSTMTC